MYELADERLRAAGFDWYEISNWARPGHRSRHNLAYWWRQPYEAVGPGAHVFDGWRGAGMPRRSRVSSPRWTLATLPPALPPGGDELVAGDLVTSETAILALRTSDGLVPATSGWVIGSGSVARLAVPIAAGLVDLRRDGRFVLTVRGRLLSNEVFGLLRHAKHLGSTSHGCRRAPRPAPLPEDPVDGCPAGWRASRWWQAWWASPSA